MARLDTISSGVWQPGTLLSGVVADGTTLVSITGLPAGWWLFGISGSCDIAWVYDVQLQDSGGNVVSGQTQRRRPAAGNEDFYFPSAVRITQNGGQLVVILRGAITVSALQMAIFTQMGSIG